MENLAPTLLPFSPLFPARIPWCTLKFRILGPKGASEPEDLRFCGPGGEVVGVDWDLA